MQPGGDRVLVLPFRMPEGDQLPDPGRRLLRKNLFKGEGKELLPGTPELAAGRLVDIDKGEGGDGQEKNAVVALVEKRPESAPVRSSFSLEFGIIGLAQGTLAEADDLLPLSCPRIFGGSEGLFIDGLYIPELRLARIGDHARIVERLFGKQRECRSR